MIRASCHCGAVHLEISERPEFFTDCNCSICRRYAALWAYYTRRSVRVIAEPDVFTKYIWGDRTIEFVHCARCGCVMYHERVEKIGDDTRMGVNARMFEPVDREGIRIRKLDGANTWAYLDE